MGCAMARSVCLSNLGDLVSRLPLWFSKVAFSLIRGGSRGRPAHPEMTCKFNWYSVLKFIYVTMQSVTLFFSGAPSPKKHPDPPLLIKTWV